MTNLIIRKARLASLKNGEYYLFCKSVLKQADELVKDKQIEVYNSQKAALVKAYEQVESGYNCSRKCPETPKLHEAEMESRRTYNTFKHAVSTNAKSHRSDKKQKAGGILSVVGGKNLSTEADDYIGFIHKAVTEIESRYMSDVESLRLDGLFEDMKIANEEAIQYQQQRDAYLAAKVKMDDARKDFETEYQKFILALEYHTLFVDGETFKPLIGYLNQLHARVGKASPKKKGNEADDAKDLDNKTGKNAKDKQNGGSAELHPEEQPQSGDDKPKEETPEAEPENGEPASGGEKGTAAGDDTTKLHPDGGKGSGEGQPDDGTNGGEEELPPMRPAN